MKKNSRQITTIIRVGLAFFFILCSVGATSIFIGCENQWIMDLTDSMYCIDCGRTKVRCICVPDEPTANLISITASYDQAGTTIYTFTDVDELKTNLTVTAFFDDDTDKILDA